MVFNFGNDMYVLPDAITLVQKGAPVVSSVAANADGSVTLTGSGFGPDSRVFFDGIQAAVQTPFSGADAQGSIAVTPPPGSSGQVSHVTVFNADGQNSTSFHLRTRPPTPIPYRERRRPPWTRPRCRRVFPRWSISTCRMPASWTAR